MGTISLAIDIATASVISAYAVSFFSHSGQFVKVPHCRRHAAFPPNHHLTFRCPAASSPCVSMVTGNGLNHGSPTGGVAGAFQYRPRLFYKNL